MSSMVLPPPSNSSSQSGRPQTLFVVFHLGGTILAESAERTKPSGDDAPWPIGRTHEPVRSVGSDRSGAAGVAALADRGLAGVLQLHDLVQSGQHVGCLRRAD